MEQGLAKVVTLDSDSENELEILSESIPNYGNYSTPVEIAPELQEKIRISLEKRGSLPGKIKTIKVYTTRRSSQVVGSVRASFRPPGGQPTKTINVGASINDLFSSQVRGGRNNNSKKPEIAPASDSAKQVQAVQKGSRQPLPVGADQRITDRPSTPSSPVILYSPIVKGKAANSEDILDGALPTLGFRQTATHPPQNQSPSTPPLVPRMKNISQCLDGENVSQTGMKTSEDFQVKKNTLKVNFDLDLNASDAVFKNVCAKVTPVELSPIRFSSDDDDDDQFVEDSILGICNSPVPSPQNYVDPPLDFEQNSPFGKVNSNYSANTSEDSKDLDVNKDTLQNMPMHIVKEMWDKMNEDENISKRQYLYEKETKINEEEESDLENLVNQDGENYEGERESVLYNETEITDVYTEEQCFNYGSENQNSKDKFAMSKYVKIDVETLPKRWLGSSVRSESESFLKVKSDKDGSDPPLWSTKYGGDPPLWSTKYGGEPPLWSTKDVSDRPLWSTIFPPTPPSPPPTSWMSSSALWELDTGGFEAVTGLCSHQTADNFKRKRNAPKPRILRKRHKK